MIVSNKSNSKSKRRESRDILINDYQQYAYYVAARMIKTLGISNDSMEDFIAAGYIGLIEAAERFDPLANTEFKSYAFWRIRGAIIDSIRLDQGLNARQIKTIRALRDLNEIRGEALKGREKKDIKEAYELVAQGALVFKMSLYEGLLDVDNIESRAINPEENLLKIEEKSILMRAVGRLPEIERKVIEDHYFKYKDFQKIGRETLGHSKSWVSRLHSRALERLKVLYLEELYGCKAP